MYPQIEGRSLYFSLSLSNTHTLSLSLSRSFSFSLSEACSGTPEWQPTHFPLTTQVLSLTLKTCDFTPSQNVYFLKSLLFTLVAPLFCGGFGFYVYTNKHADSFCFNPSCTYIRINMHLYACTYKHPEKSLSSPLIHTCIHTRMHTFAYA